MRHPKRLLRYSIGLALPLIALLISNAHHLARAPKPDNPNLGAPPAKEPLTSIVERYAPFVFAATEARGGRQDVISNIDFDGDLVGNNNWENFERFELKPTVSIREVPRFYDANRFSGPFGSDRGISPFALDFSFDRGTLGALFFNPARRYKEHLKIDGPWSLEYINYPFAR